MLRALGAVSCDILRLVISIRDNWYELFRTLGVASCDIVRETGDTICYEHWVLHLVISHTRQAVRFVSGIGFGVLRFLTQDRGYDL